MRTLIYKRTHCGDPDPEGRFGINTCMGKVRTWLFEAVIGVGGISAKPKSLVRKVNWIGIGAQPSGKFDKRGDPIITFKKFLLFSPEGGEPAKELRELAPALAARLYKDSKHFLMNDLSLVEQGEVDKILALAKDADRSSAEVASPVTTSGGCVPRPPSPKAIKGCSCRLAPRPAARTKC